MLSLLGYTIFLCAGKQPEYRLQFSAFIVATRRTTCAEGFVPRPRLRIISNRYIFRGSEAKRLRGAMGTDPTVRALA